MSLPLESICQQSRVLIENVAQYLAQQKTQVANISIEEKAKNHLVSYVDRTAEEQLVAGLEKILPDSVFLTEEGTVTQKEGQLKWIIDPLDGTTNFLHQLPIFSISVALQENDETVLGIVYEVNQQECFYAWKDGGAFMNDQPIQVRQNDQLKDSLLATGFPYYDYEKTKPYFEVLEYFARETRGLRRFGSAAVDLVYVACGRFDAFYEYSLSPWDVAAGAFIVKEAGGVVSDFSGGDNYLYGRELLASSSGLYPEMLQAIKKAFTSV